MFFLFAHVVLHLDRFLFLLPDLFSSPYSYIWMNLIIVFLNNMFFFIIIQSEHIFRCLLIFLNDFLSILIQFLTSNDWDARITICLCPDCRRACLGAQFRFVYCPFITVDQLFSIVFICLKGILLSNYLSSPVYLY